MTGSISFSGCGFLMSYHVGVAMCLRQFAPELLAGKICATSSGLLVAISLICDIPLGVITTEILRITNLARSFALGPLDPRFNLARCMEEVLRNHLPDDAHERASGRLFISVTRIHDKSNVVLSEFRYREHLIKAVLAASFIPTYSGLVPQPYQGVRYMDGAVTDNQPVIDEGTLRVSPFPGDEMDICPGRSNVATTSASATQAGFLNLVSEENLSRLFRVFVPQDAAATVRLCQRGFDDALGYLQCNKRAVLAKSFFISSTFLIIEDEDKQQTAAAVAALRATNDEEGYKYNDQQWETASFPPPSATLSAGNGEEKLNDIDSSVLSPSESILKTLNINGDDAEDGLGRGGKARRTIHPVDLIVANLKSVVGSSVENRDFKMRLPKYEPRLAGSRTARGHVSAYFKRYLLHPVTQILSDKICEASRVVLNKVNKRVNVEVLTDLLLRKPEQASAPEDLKLLKHILQMTNEQTPFETLYFIEASNKIHVTELFDISDCEDTSLQTETERELNQLLEFDIDDWGDADFGYSASGWDDNMPGELFPDGVREEEEEVDGLLTSYNSSSGIGDDSDLLSSRTTDDDDDVQGLLERISSAAATTGPLSLSTPPDDDADGGDDDPYISRNLTGSPSSSPKALGMSPEYNEFILGTVRHAEGLLDEQDGAGGPGAPATRW